MHQDDHAPRRGTGGEVAALHGVSKVYEPSSRLLSLFVRSSISSAVHALTDIDLTVDPGQLKAVVGPNGAGKTTLFRIIVGLTTPTTGSAEVMGLDATHRAEQARRHIGFMPSDDRSLFMRLSCAENLRFHGRIHGMKGPRLDAAIAESLEVVGIGHRQDSAVFSLSAGMRARVQLARAIIHRPALLVLDEPTATIDPVASHQLLGVLEALVSEFRMGALISSHRLEEIEALSTNVVLLDRGRMRFHGDLATLRSQMDQPHYELTFTDEMAASRARPAIERLAVVHDVLGARIECAPHRGMMIGQVLAALGQELPSLEHCREHPMPLRDLLAQMYGEPDTAVPDPAAPEAV